ncbi:hypothetical protein ACFL03_15455 [Thermodesulfobacteriota bacterium]
MKASVPSETDILLTLYVPVKNARKYKKKLSEYLRNALESGVDIGDKKDNDSKSILDDAIESPIRF